MAESAGVQQELTFQQKVEKHLKPDEAKQYGFVIERIKRAVEQREQKWEYFDDLPYSIDYSLNRKAKNTYLRPKLNDSEVRINTGTTEKKIETVWNELLNMNLQPEVRAFDNQDLEIAELGEDIADVVKRTNEMERDDDVWNDAVGELITQRAVFLDDTLANEDYVLFRKKLISGMKVFLGDITIPAYLSHTQPYMVICDRVHYSEAERMFGKNKNWGMVRPGNAGSEFDGVFNFRVGGLEQNEVEIIRYMDYPNKEYQVYIGMVPMFETNYKHPSKYCWYPKMFTLKGMDIDFAYGKPLTASAKVLQMLDNETIRLLIWKFRQAIEPPIGSKGKQVYSKDIWNPGSVTQGVTKDTFSSLIDHQGVTNSELAMYDLITKKTEEFIGSSNLMQGLQPSGDPTATQVQEQLKQGIKSLGLAVLAVMRMKRDMTYARIERIIEAGQNPVSKRKNALTGAIENVYRQFTVSDANLGYGKQGKKIIAFSDRDMTENELESIKSLEEESDEMGTPTRFKSINAKKLNEVTVNWYVTVVSSPKDSSILDKITFKDKLAQAVPIAQIAGRQLAGDVIVEDFERTWKAKNWFEDRNLALGEVMPPVDPSLQGQQMKNGMKEQKPSINTMTNA